MLAQSTRKGPQIHDKVEPILMSHGKAQGTWSSWDGVRGLGTPCVRFLSPVPGSCLSSSWQGEAIESVRLAAKPQLTFWQQDP